MPKWESGYLGKHCLIMKETLRLLKNPQEHFHHHFKLPKHNGMDDWRVSLTHSFFTVT